MAPAIRVKLSTGKKQPDPSTPKPDATSSTAATPGTAASMGPKIKLFSSGTPSSTPAPVTPAPGTAKAKNKFVAKEAAVDNSPAPGSAPGRSNAIKLPKGKKRPHNETITSAAAPPPATPSTPISTSTPGGEVKKTIKLSLQPSRLKVTDSAVPSTPVPAPDTATPAPDKPKIQLKSLKVSLGKAKPKAGAAGTAVLGPDGKPKRTTLPNLKIKGLGKPPVRVHGEGYDSEDDEAEIDPAIESQIIFRMAPGEDCEYLREAIAERRIGHPDPRQRAKFTLRFFDRDGRRAVVNIRGNLYAAALVDLPCIIEGNKTWDRKNIYKAADICQMLLVLGPVEDEEAAKSFPIPKEVDPHTWAYPHGITPPMHQVRTRRFRKRISYHTIEQIESQVEQLLEADRRAKESGGMSQYRVIDEGVDDDDDDEEDEEMEGADDGEVEMSEMEVDEDGVAGASDGDDNGFDEAALAEMAALMADDDDDDAAAAPVGAIGGAGADGGDAVMKDLDGSKASGAVEGGAETPQAEDEDDDDDDDDDDEDEDEDEQEDEMNEETLARQNELLELKEQIDEIDADLRIKRAQLETQENRLLRNRLQSAIERLVQDLDVRKKEYVSKGGVLDDEDDE